MKGTLLSLTLFFCPALDMCTHCRCRHRNFRCMEFSSFLYLFMWSSSLAPAYRVEERESERNPSAKLITDSNSMTASRLHALRHTGESVFRVLWRLMLSSHAHVLETHESLATNTSRTRLSLTMTCIPVAFCGRHACSSMQSIPVAETPHTHAGRYMHAYLSRSQSISG